MFDSSPNCSRKTLFCSRSSTIASLLILRLTPWLTGCVPRAESHVGVYSSLDRDFATHILDGFERKQVHETGVVPKFDVESTKTVGLVNLIIAERQTPACDLFWNNEIMHTVRLQKQGLLQPHDWKVEPGWPSEMIASDGTWCGFAARARVLIVNTQLIESPDAYPRSVAELADPKWAQNCAMARPLFGTTATHFAVLRETQGRDATIDQLQSINENAVILSGNKQVAVAVSAGRLAWGLTDTDDAVIEQDLGRPVAIVFPDQQPDQPGTLRIPNTIALIKGAPHAVAAGLLADYLMRPEIEDRLAMGDSSQLPISRQSKYPPRVLPAEPIRWMQADFEQAADDWEDWSAELNQIFTN